MRTLATLKPGDKGTIINVTAPNSLRQRLYDLGLTPGTEVDLVKFAPLGDPIEIKLRGYRLTLRKNEAIFVILEEQKHD